MAMAVMAMDIMARGKPRLLLLPSLDMATTEDMVMVDMVTTAIMARGPLMLMPSTATEAMEATEATEDMVMDTVMATTARDLRMPPMATVMAMVMVMVMVTVMVMGTDTTDKKEGIVITSRVQWI